ncbi:flagellar hook protein FlgE [Alkalithermobacter thermoalcaliphilus JW-YL-7 = DSM 7308]|uniref:Flagellar hook protein FlgE n=1 Tax=Alkalithermobacter thermoalcaliphilus JW-YL-7 = DSM 7308 TaxID=1121328 RepID=A0A150FQ92_CLOPD|nr:flagellar hook-basal body protein [[Clostridium] paradoxum JW-YL-7 = DSM 7308]SHK61207.1 flagellar hook protein FlgE [[Clostridium] paradoxum JW-YL-7 = DSM 7308]
MMRSMYSAISSLRAHQLKMDVIGNNIANVNTVAYKGSRVTFKETFNQTIKGAGAAQDGRGGTNPMQVGLGTDVAAVDIIHTRGASERTDSPTDLMINGEGFFIVSDDPNYLNRYYTRAGNFSIDVNGNLVTQDGYKVLGYMADESGYLKSNIEALRIDKSIVYPPQATKPTPNNPEEDVVIFSGNLNSLAQPTGDVVNIGNSGSVYRKDLTISKGKVLYIPEDEYKQSIGRETTMEVFDDFGNVHRIKLVFIKKEVSTDPPETTWNVEAFYLHPDGNMYRNKVQSITLGTDGNPVENEGANGFMYGTKDASGALQAGGFEIKFDEKGLVKGDGKMTFKIGKELTAGADELVFDINLSNLTQFASTSTAAATYIKGYKQGSLTDFAIAPNGEIIGNFDNGQRRVLGRVALANFTNPAGLQKMQSNMFISTRNSGLAVIGFPSTNGFADLNPGTLEMSNVDLGREFTNMITTQRGFQANSRVITTTDQMLEELVNLKR